jgi:hypothetical protein
MSAYDPSATNFHRDAQTAHSLNGVVGYGLTPHFYRVADCKGTLRSQEVRDADDARWRDGSGMPLRHGALSREADGRVQDGPPLHLFLLPDERSGGGVGRYRRHLISGRRRSVDALSVQHGVAQHYFCSKCGIYTHHRRRSNPNQYGVNVACLKGASPFDFDDVPVIDGINHPKDNGTGYEIVGHLRYVRVEEGPKAPA